MGRVKEGMAQVRGHRSPAEFLQVITGGSKSEARQRIRVGQSVLDATEPTTDPATGAGAVGTSGARVVPAWHAPLADALMRGQVSSAQSDAIRRGLGEPPTDRDRNRRRRHTGRMVDRGQVSSRTKPNTAPSKSCVMRHG